ncbi:hypothetical protein [Paraburkholderia bannensis]|uniref:hypothetical protein n=1 Tax=Paraburkholderia bannensis TaxID=765414 RepID=UPI002ABD9780|nr:hypothetical protein [Paraburkholderia bannensis]
MQTTEKNQTPDHGTCTTPTALYVVLFATILQSVMSFISLASFAGFFWRQSAVLAQTYTVQQRASWVVTALWAIVALVVAIAMVRRRERARTVYAGAGAVTIAAWFALLPWPLAVVGAVPIAWTVAVLYRTSTNRYFADTPSGAATCRARVAQTLFAFSTALLYATYLGTFLGHGWMHDQFGGRPPLYHFVAWLVILVTALIIASRGARAWTLGVALMVFVVALAAAMIGFVPYTALLVHAMGPHYQAYEILWGPMFLGMAVLAFVAWLALRTAKGWWRRQEPPPHGKMPDFG